MNLDKALWLARRLGCTVEPRRRTGEVVVAHPAIPRPVVHNARRESASRALTGLLAKLWGRLFGDQAGVCI